MDELESLNDNELREYLLQCGFPNTPITDTTRKILIKRLRNHLNKKKTQLKKQIVSATRFSSDEESDIDQNRKEFESYKNTSNSNFLNNSGFSNFTPPKLLKNIQNSSYRNSQLSSPNMSKSGNINNLSYNSNNATSYDKYKISPTSRIYVSPTFSYPDRQDSTSFQKNNETYDVSDYSDVEFNNHPVDIKTNSIYSNNNDENLLYRSNFTRRLLNLRSETLANTKTQPNKHQTHTEQINSVSNSYNNVPLIGTSLNRRTNIKDKRSNIGENSYDINNLSPSSAFKNVLSSLNEHYGVQQHFIPCSLVSITIIFFISLSFLYINITPNLISTVTEKNLRINFCKSSAELNLKKPNIDYSNSLHNPQQNSVTCIYRNQVSDALEVIKFIIPILQDSAEYHYCKDRTSKFTVNSRYLINKMFESIAKKGGAPDIRKINHDLKNADFLIENNFQWHVSHVNEMGEVLSFDDMVKMRRNNDNYYAILNPSLPLFCSIYNKLEKFFFLIGSLALVLVIIGTGYVLFKVIVNYRQKKQQSVFHFIEEIINNLITKAERTPNEKSVVVNHLRDMLIPVHKRKEMEWAWNKAILYLEQNESRVVFEMGVVNGEDCQMIKWIDTVSPDNITENRKSYIVKKWESPAFIDKTNKIRNPPTPCLKIRQMFDKSEASNLNLTQVIHDAILEKVGLNCKIYDIQIDKQSCCVYVRCASEQDAGMVHDEINGWWFDKRLVSIKFLRLERYLTRFPNSSAGPKCLYPSNSKKLSISLCSTNLRDYNEDDDTDEE